MADKNPQSQQPQPPGIFPPPVIQPPPQMGDLSQEALQTSQFGRQQLATELDRLRNYQSMQDPLIENARQLAGHLSYHPQMAPMTGHGVGHDILNVLGNLGKGALTGLAATGPGQAIQGQVYGPQRQQYAADIQAIKERQGQMEEEGKTVGPLASMGYHPLYPATKARQVDIQAQQHFQQMTQEQWKTLGELSMKAKQLELGGRKVEAENARTQMNGIVAQISAAARNFATQAGIDNVDMENFVKQQIANVTQAGEMTREHPIGQQLGITPPAPQIPVGPKPQRKAVAPGAKPQGSNQQQGKGTVRLQSGGTYYNVPRHMVGEFKKDHPDAR